MQYDTNYGDDDTNIDTEIIDILENTGVMRRRNLITRLKEVHLDERGYSLPTINRKIDRLVKDNKIAIIKKN